MPRTSNSTFAKRTGYHHTMVSRIRNGHRMPSTGMLAQICQVFDLDHKKYLEAHQQGRHVFSALLREEVFGPKPDEDGFDPDEPSPHSVSTKEPTPCESESSGT